MEDIFYICIPEIKLPKIKIPHLNVTDAVNLPPMLFPSPLPIITINVNGKNIILVKDTLSYEELSEYVKDQPHPTITCKTKAGGRTLIPGQTIQLEDGMSFTVINTGNA